MEKGATNGIDETIGETKGASVGGIGTGLMDTASDADIGEGTNGVGDGSTMGRIVGTKDDAEDETVVWVDVGEGIWERVAGVEERSIAERNVGT